MKLGVFILTILSCGAAMTDIAPENQVEGKQISLVRIPRRFRFRINYRRRYATTPSPENAYPVNNPYGMPMGNRRISHNTSTTPSMGGEIGGTTLEGVTMRLEDATIPEVREDSTLPAVREDATIPDVREGVTELPTVQSEWRETDYGEFMFHKEGATWDDAKAICEADGAFLTVLDSEGLKNDLLSFLEEPQDVTGADASWMYYLGYSGTNGEFQVTPNGAPISVTGYSPWCAGSPATVADQKCGAIDTTCKGLIDINCSLKLAFFCSRFE